jgi:hypothetical protein
MATEEENSTLSDDIAAAFEAAEASETPDTTPSPDETTTPTGDQGGDKKTEEPTRTGGKESDENGTGAPDASGEGKEINVDNPDNNSGGDGADVPEGDKSGAQPATSEAPKAPASWKPADREEWSKIPPSIQQTITKREQEIQKTMTETAQQRQVANQFNEMVTPYQQIFAAQQITPMQGLNALLQTAATLQTGTPAQKAQMAINIIQDYGVDLQAMDQILQGGAGDQGGNAQVVNSPEYQQLQQKVANMEAAQNLQAQQAQQAMNEEVRAFLAANEFAQDVRNDMADFMDLAKKRGQVMTLEEAYNRAIAGRPDIQQIISARKTQQTQEEALERARKAKKSVPQSNGNHQAPQVPDTLRGAIEEAWGD